MPSDAESEAEYDDVRVARSGVSIDAWALIRAATPARVGIGRTGNSIPVEANLRFELDHARARDAVHAPFDLATLSDALRAGGHDVLTLHTAAADRATYLKRPDLGRRLDDASRDLLLARHGAMPGADAAFVVTDGLSAQAVVESAPGLLTRAVDRLRALGWTVAPTVVVTNGRVAIGDEIGAALEARHVVVLLGERPGLSVPRSLGAYLTAAPRPGRTDAERNCISNIHERGLGLDAAAALLVHLLVEARRLGGTGVGLKDERGMGQTGDGRVSRLVRRSLVCRLPPCD